MVILLCPFCGQRVHIQPELPPEEWCRKQYPEGELWDPVPAPCPSCYKKVRRGAIDLAGFELVPSIRKWLESELPTQEEWTLDTDSDLWIKKVAHLGRKIELVILGREFSSEGAAVLIAIADCSEEVAKSAVRFARGFSPWPDGYAEPVLEQVVADCSEDSVSARLDFEVGTPLPPIALSVVLEDRTPVRSEWEYA